MEFNHRNNIPKKGTKRAQFLKLQTMKMKSQPLKLFNYVALSGGPDETRTRDLRRDRAAF